MSYSSLWFFYSCKNHGTGSETATPVVSLESGDNDLSHEDVIEIIDWIEIKADSSLFIDNPAKVEYYGSDYYILDNRNQKCVLRYASDGTLINKIGQLGQGPEEYSSIVDFSIDRSNGRVIVLSMEPTLYLYSTDGTFERKVSPTEDIISRISCNSKGLMTSSDYSSPTTDTDNFLLSEFDNEFNQIGRWIPYCEPKRPSFSPLGPDCLVTLGELTYYFDDINLDLITYDSKSNVASTLMSFDLCNRMPEDIFSDNMRFISEQLIYNWVKDFVVVGNHIIAGYIYDRNFSISIVDKTGKIVTSGKFHGPFPQCYPLDDNTVISPISVDSYLNYWENQSDIPKPSFDVSEDTNLLLMKWKLK